MPTARRTYSDPEAKRLIEQYRTTGDSRLRDELVEHMRPLVSAIARKFAGKEPLEDLESEGWVGLIRAVDHFCPERGTRFSTYATHLIAGQIRHYLRDRGHLIRQPAWLQELSSRVERATAELEQQLQREPTVAEVAAATNLTEEAIEELFSARQAAEVVRMVVGSDQADDDYLIVDPDKIRNRHYVTLELPIEDRIVLENAISKLKDLERKVLYYFFYQDYNQSDIARRLGISCNYAGHLLRNGLKHVREGLSADGVRLRQSYGTGETVLDPETGLYTAAHLERRLREEISRSQRYHQPMAFCCVLLPEATPDAAVCDAADVLRSRIRRADIAGRTRSREFGVILPHTDDAAPRVAEILRRELAELLRLPVRAGAAIYPDAGRTAQELQDAARTLASSAVLPEPVTVP